MSTVLNKHKKSLSIQYTDPRNRHLQSELKSINRTELSEINMSSIESARDNSRTIDNSYSNIMSQKDLEVKYPFTGKGRKLKHIAKRGSVADLNLTSTVKTKSYKQDIVQKYMRRTDSDNSIKIIDNGPEP
jgi:hypothetical protein